ncbi:phenylacetaldoxime dehydratase family protein [Actinomycetospora corticicola]|uniref:Aldoxime dehydratase n=1 Tax=Actinomycetospora corticicola TaxID=663602 RepID=A0A7Y9DT90_9PSEU|nr:aldoxime dehydratase [Actinomycetospora corticicola]
MSWTVSYPRVLPERRPPGHEPRAPRWTLVLDAPTSLLTADYLAVQLPERGGPAEEEFLALARASADGPESTELLVATGPEGTVELVHLAYWKDPTAHERWLHDAPLPTWFDRLDPATATIGAWHEVLQVHPDRFETIYSDPRWPFGFAGCRGTSREPMTTNGYFGAARDRFPVSAIDPLEAVGKQVRRTDVPSRGRRLRVECSHDTAVIRSGQFWEPAEGEQLVDYEHNLQSKLLTGMDHLREHPTDTGTLSLRILTSLDPASLAPRRETSVLGYFHALGELEEWAASHHTHLAIYEHAIEAKRHWGDARSVVTWHEVVVLPRSARFEYVNCVPTTGLLPFAPTLLTLP